MALSRGDIRAHGVQRHRGTPASEEARQEERDAGAPSERLKRAAHRGYYTTRLDVARDETVYSCWVCGTIMREIKCKIVCPHCGYTRDCSDP